MSSTTEKNGLLSAPLGNKSVVERVMDRITGAIINGELRPGDKIPTELELCEALQVGRNSVREAIKVLESFGVLHIKRSEGTFVADSLGRRMLDPMLYGVILQKDSGAEIQELRQVIDTGILQLAMEKASPARLEPVEKALAALGAEIAGPVPSTERLHAADVAFHKAVTDVTGNPLIISVAGYIDRITVPTRLRTMDFIIRSRELPLLHELHESLLTVIKERRQDRIPATVHRHYQFWRKEMAAQSDDSGEQQ